MGEGCLSKVRALPTRAVLQGLFHYDPDTGIFTRRIRCGRQIAGKVAGSRRKRGYIIISVDGVLFLAHRLAFAYMTGSAPDEIDHIDGDKSNNRWSNLRDASRSQNMANAVRSKPNATGIKGVYPNRKGFCAKITVNYVQKSLGTYPTREEAAAAYERAARAHFGEFAKVA